MRLLLGLTIAYVALGVAECACPHRSCCCCHAEEKPENKLKKACQEAEGIGFIYSSEANFCYKVHTDELTWDDALEQCKNEGGLLAKVDTALKGELVNSIIKEDGTRDDYRLGATGDAEPRVWRWIADNSIIPGFVQSSTGYPCLEIQHDFDFDSAPCNSVANRYICEILLPK